MQKLNEEQKERLKKAQETVRQRLYVELDKVIVELFPEATSGDDEPLVLFAFDRALDILVDDWVYWNVPGYGDSEE